VRNSPLKSIIPLQKSHAYSFPFLHVHLRRISASRKYFRRAFGVLGTSFGMASVMMGFLDGEGSVVVR